MTRFAGRPLVVLVLVAALLAAAALAGAPACNCGEGNVESSSPQCICACSGAYLTPNCLYTADDDVRMEFWLTIQPEEFSSDQFRLTLVHALSTGSRPSTSIAYDYSVSSKNKTNAYYTVKGDQAQLLYRDFETNHPWLRRANVESVFQDVRRPAPVSPLQQIAVIYKDDTIEINSENVAWLLSAIFLFLFGVLVECCCMQNEEEIVLEKENEEVMGYGKSRSPGTMSPRESTPADEMATSPKNKKKSKKKNEEFLTAGPA